MIARPLKIVTDDRKHENIYDRRLARERVQLLTVREGTCGERWGSWAIRFNPKDEPKL